MNKPAIAITPGEPAGIGPDLVVMLAQEAWPAALIAVSDPALLEQSAARLGLPLALTPAGNPPFADHAPGSLLVDAVSLPGPVEPGQGSPSNASYVLDCLRRATTGCTDGRFDALVTGPVNKSLISDSGVAFTGHTGFLAELTNTQTPVMLFEAGSLRVALLTVHIPLAEVAGAVTSELLLSTLQVIDADLKNRFGISNPKLAVLGLNPHAGEQGLLGKEEINVIAPAIAKARRNGIDVNGPIPADTAFTPAKAGQSDCIVSIYHDQALPVVKYAGFGNAVNITLGLPILRTSVDHGTAFDLAGTGRADAGSLRAALRRAIELS